MQKKKSLNERFALRVLTLSFQDSKTERLSKYLLFQGKRVLLLKVFQYGFGAKISQLPNAFGGNPGGNLDSLHSRKAQKYPCQKEKEEMNLELHTTTARLLTVLWSET